MYWYCWTSFIVCLLIIVLVLCVPGCASGERVATSEITGIATTQPMDVKIVGIDKPTLQMLSTSIAQGGEGNVQNIGDKWSMRALIWFGGVVSMLVLALVFYLLYLISHRFREQRERCK